MLNLLYVFFKKKKVKLKFIKRAVCFGKSPIFKKGDSEWTFGVDGFIRGYDSPLEIRFYKENDCANVSYF